MSPRSAIALPDAHALGRVGLVAAVVSGVAVLSLLATYHLDLYPTTWFDEGSHLHVPKALVQFGAYADTSSEGFRYFGPTIGIGPTIMLPIAAAFKLFGIGLLQARLVITAYLALALLCFAALAHRYYGAAVAALATALLVTSPGVDLLYFGRQVLGEIPAFAFLMLGLLAWRAATGQPAVSTRRLLLASLAFALVALTKNQFSLILMPTFVVAALLDRVFYRSVGTRAYALPLLGICVGIGVGLVVQFAPALASQDFGQTLIAYRDASAGAIFVFSPARIASSLKFLASADVFGYWGLPAVLYGVILSWQRSRRGAQQALLTVFVILGLAWYAFGSIGWPRYAFPALAITAIFAAKLVVDITRALLRSGRSQAPAVAAVAGLLALLVVSPLVVEAQKIVSTTDRSPQQLAAYLNANVPPTSVIETWEPELGFLTNHAYHYPPTGWLDRAVRAQWLASVGPRQVYDPIEAAHPDLLVVGRFGKYTGIYTPLVEQLGAGPVASFGEYDVYALR